MPKTMVIFRHAKSTWDYTSVPDIDRPLKELGIANARLVAQKLRGNGISPDCLISSPAIRALHTALIVARELGFEMDKTRIDSALYEGDEDDVLRVVKALPDQFNCVFVFGHNQTFTNLVNRFLVPKIDNLPTSGAGVFEFGIEQWGVMSEANLKSGCCFFPKNL